MNDKPKQKWRVKKTKTFEPHGLIPPENLTPWDCTDAR